MAWHHTLKARWLALGLREQRALMLAFAVLAAALVWSVAVAPALRTLKSAAAQTAQLGVTAERMQALQARALALQAKPEAAPGDVLKSLQTATLALGKSASLQVVGEQATLTLKQVRVADLAPWLAPMAGGRPGPAEVHLQREAAATEPLWSGRLVYRLPARQAGKP